MNEKALEQETQNKGLNAPRLTLAHIDEQIVDDAFYVFPETTVTVCCLTLRNGYNVVAHSACVSVDNFDLDIGKQIAFDNARDKIWELEAYLLRDWVNANEQEVAKDPAAIQREFDAFVDRCDMPSGA